MSFLLAFLLTLTLLLSPTASFAQKSPSADAKSQPKVNFFNPSRAYKRPVLIFFKKMGFSINSDFSSRYVWNGIAYSEGPVWQPSAAVEFHGFGASVLGNFVLNDEPNQGQFNEVDFTAYYGTKIKKLEIDLSFTYSIYPNDNPASLNFGPNALEALLHVAHPVGPITLFTDLNPWIINPGGGFFWDVGIGYQKNLPLNFALSTSALFGLSNGRYNRFFIGSDVGITANLFNYSLSFPWSPVKGFIITSTFNVSTLLNGELRSAQSYPTNVWADVNFEYDF